MGPLGNSGYKEEVPEYGLRFFSSLTVSSPEAMVPLKGQE